MNSVRFRFAITSFLSLWLILVAAVQSHAANVIADTPCDPLYYESLSARAWLEAQREITQNQNLILKPDSVFEYTCFDRLVRELADHADEMLSETSSYGSSLGTSSMDNALQKLVGTSLISYINNNFAGDSYNLLAGHPAATGLKSVPLAITNQKKYNCDIMARVWQAAKCINFITDTDTDGFYTFQEYATDTADKRHLPTACTAITSDWNDNLVNALTSGAWTNDPVQTYFTLTEPEDCTGKACPCSGEPIPTGIKVISEAGFHEEHICLQPGCRYYSGIGDLAVGIPKVKPGCYGR